MGDDTKYMASGGMAAFIIFLWAIFSSKWVLVSPQDCATESDFCHMDFQPLDCCPGLVCIYTGPDYFSCLPIGEQGQECQIADQLCDPPYSPCCEGLSCNYN